MLCSTLNSTNSHRNTCYENSGQLKGQWNESTNESRIKGKDEGE